MRDRVVYFIEAGKGGPIKIGVSVDVNDRIRTLQTATTRPLRVIVTVPGSFDLENLLHRHFADERKNNEWFKGRGPVRDFAAALAAANENERIAMLDAIRTAPKTRRARAQERRRYTSDELRELLCVGDSGDVYRSAEAERLVLARDKRLAGWSRKP